MSNHFKKTRAEQKNAKLLEVIKLNNTKKFYDFIKSKPKSDLKLPPRMMFKNKVYSGDNQVLQVFATVAKESSTDPTIEDGVEISSEYISMRYAAKAALGIAHMSELEMVPLNGDTFRRLLRDVTLNKSPDSNGVASEHILFGSEGTLEVVMEMKKRMKYGKLGLKLLNC